MTWNKFYKKEVFDKSSIRFNENVVHIEDLVLNYEMFLYCSNIKTIPMTGYKYVRYPDSTTGRYTPSFENSISVLNGLYSKLCERAGFSEDKITQILLKRKYSETYICVINLFRHDSRLTFREKIRHVKVLLNDSEFVKSKTIEGINEKKMNLRIFEFFVKMRSAFLLSISYTILFHMRSVYIYLKRL